MSYPIPYVAIIDIGHGNSTVLRDAEDTIIIDCGARGSGLLEFLKKESIDTINSIFLSHADQDHIGGLLALIASDEFSINKIYVNADASKGSALWADMTYELSQLSEKRKIEFVIGISRTNNIFSCGSIELVVVGPTAHLAAKGAGGLDRWNREITSNSISASFQVLWKGLAIAFLAGDIDQINLDDLVDHKISLESPVLLFPHHGGKSEAFNIIEFTKQLCSLVKPKIVIFSIGREKYNNPRPEVVSTVRTLIKDVRISCTQLSKYCSKLLPKEIPAHLVKVFSKGHERNECCSGTFIIKLGETVEYLPQIHLHQKFIYESAPTALCFTS
jgi:beta-lactamase superfamily II metal-dependent hydrolase